MTNALLSFRHDCHHSSCHLHYGRFREGLEKLADVTSSDRLAYAISVCDLFDNLLLGQAMLEMIEHESCCRVEQKHLASNFVKNNGAIPVAGHMDAD